MRRLLRALLGGAALGAGVGCSAPDDLGDLTKQASSLVVRGQQKLEAPDPGFGDRFGSAVAISGGTAILGSSADDGSSGSAFVFARSGTGWLLQQKLVAAPRSPRTLFGASVAISHDVALIGAPQEDVGTGAAYVFTQSGAHWALSQRLTDQGATRPFEQLGTAVALGDTVLAVGGRHSVGIYSRAGAVWTFEQTLGLPHDATDFGFALALSGATLLVGGREGVNLGTAYVYVRQGVQWSLQQRLVAAAGQDAAGFGASVALDGNTALVGASNAPGTTPAPGSAHVFTRSGSAWPQQQVLTASDLTTGDQFGTSVALFGELALVGAPFHDHFDGAVDQGAAYLFMRSAGQWSGEQELRAQDGNGHDYLGAVVALAEDTALVAAPNDDGVQGAQGSAYAFTLLQEGTGTLGCVRVTPDGDDVTAQATNGATPFGSVQAAIDFADTHRGIATAVCVAAGPDCSATATYPGPPSGDLRMRHRISVVGRYESSGWTRCAGTHTWLAPRTPLGVVFGTEIVGDTTLDGFAIVPSPAATTAAVTVQSADGVQLLDIVVPEQRWPESQRPQRSVGIRVDADSMVSIEGGDVFASPGTVASIGLDVVGAWIAVDGLAVHATGPGRAIGVELNGTSNATFSHGSIDATGFDAAGFVATGSLQALLLDESEIGVVGTKAHGVYVDSELATGVTINGNRVRATSSTNVAGIELLGGGGPVVTGNMVQCDGGRASAVAIGIDCHSRQAAGSLVGCTRVANNVVHALSLAPADRGSAVYQATGLFIDGVHTLVDANRFDAGCGAGRNGTRAIGIFARGDVRIQNNVAEGARCPTLFGKSYGLWVDAPSPGGMIDVHSNTLLGGNSSGGNTIALELAGGGAILRNNLLDPGASNGAFNIDQASTAAAPNVLENNDFVAGSSESGLYRIMGAPDPRSIEEINARPGAGANFQARCSPLAGSACVNAGTTTSAPDHDIDGDPRSDGKPDVGPDELRPGTGGCKAAEGCGDLPLCKTRPLGTPCLNGGVPVQVADGQVCDCPPGLGGSVCELEFVELAGGNNHVCGIRNDGSTACWGQASDGQSNPPPTQFTTLSAGQAHNCGIRRDGRLECWGDDEEGQSTPPDGRFTQISAGTFHTCGIREDGDIKCWGYNADGQTLAPPGAFSRVAAGGNHSCALRSDGSIVCWGSNAVGQLDAPSGAFLAVTAGYLHSCALRQDGTVQCWGDDTSGQASAPALTFTRLTSSWGSTNCGMTLEGTIHCWGYGADESTLSGSFEHMAVGDGFVCGERSDGRIECAGANDGAGQLTPPGGAFRAVSVAFHTCTLRQSGGVACFGYNEFGQSTPPAGTFTAIAAGIASFTCGLRPDATLACWGNNDGGLGSEGGQATPPSGTFVSLTAGGGHACAVRANDTVACWGDDTTGAATPPDAAFSAVSAGGGYSCGLAPDGTTSCWGLNDQGQTDAPDSVFALISSGLVHSCGVRPNGGVECWGSTGLGMSSPPPDAFRAVSAGGSHTCGIRSDGTLTCWGADTGRSPPPTGTFVAISAGMNHNCAIGCDLTLHCWGGLAR
jgi:alpha-tubulin suppressor-like RCC1 family protein